MLVSLIKGNKISQLLLPNKIIGNYWVTDYENNEENQLINIEALNGKWCLISNDDISIVENNEEKRYVYLQEYAFYLLKIKNTSTYLLLYCSPIYDYTYQKYLVNSNQSISIGNSTNNYIYYNNSGVDTTQAQLVYSSGRFLIVDNDSRLGVYVNNKRIYKQRFLENGDIIFIAGLKIIVALEGSNPYILVNNPDDLVRCRLKPIEMEKNKDTNLLDITNDLDDVLDKPLYKKNDYFYKKYRSVENIKNLSLQVTMPKEDKNHHQLFLLIGPMFLLAIIGIISIVLAVVSNKEIVCLLISIIMFISLVLWPIIIKQIERIKKDKTIHEYNNYLSIKRQSIKENIDKQKKQLLNNNKNAYECEQIILEKKSNLWERGYEDTDFLNICLGLGTLPSDITIKYPQENYTIDNTLYDQIKKLDQEPRQLVDVPLTISLRDKRILALIGSKRLNKKFIRQLLIQLVALHSYRQLKIVILTSKYHEDKWSYFKTLPHCFSDDKKIRFFASNDEEIGIICNYLKMNSEEHNLPYYIIITDNIVKVRNYQYINSLLHNDNDMTSLIVLDDSLINIPDECHNFILVDDNESTYYENNLNGIKFKFKIDFSIRLNLDECCHKLANIPIMSMDNDLPKTYGFLDMYKVGTVEQLNIYNRWKNANAALSLKAPIGIDNFSELINLNLHKDYQGSHGLIVGIPGSGKTEFLITYILSMSINYHPRDVQFVILEPTNQLKNIFNNPEKGIKLPHLIGSFNDEEIELKRFMTSFKSELTKRYDLFNKASEKCNQRILDIYQYQQLYRNKLVEIPLSHLFIVIDEYDKIEEQHHTFIDKLLKISHIYPTLGVHFIFSTDRKDSIETSEFIDIFGSKIFMYNLVNKDRIINYPGRFYLSDSYNELLIGQGAISNRPYIPVAKYKTPVDNAVEFVDNIGNIYKKIDIIKRSNRIDSTNIELTNILRYITKQAESENIRVNPLCLEKISEYITVANLMRKYEVCPKKYVVEPIVGEYEDLNNHVHNILRIPLTTTNSAIYSINENEIQNFISSMLFSSMYLYTPEELNYYIIDLGTDYLSDFKACPLVGDIITGDELDKIDNLFKVIENKLSERQILFKAYENNYECYLRNSKKVIPLIVIIINNYHLFSNIYNKYIETIDKLLDSSCNYGIHFVISNNKPIPELINKCHSYFLKQYNKLDYNRFFNESITNYPDDILGRGLTKINGYICEFQTAYASPKNKDHHEFIIKQSKECAKEYNSGALEIPVLPEHLTFKQVKHELGKSNKMIIGYNNELKMVKYDFDVKPVSIISGEKMSTIAQFVRPLIKQFAYLNRTDVIVFDALQADIALNINNLRYINNNFNDNFKLLENYIDNIESLYKDKTYYNAELKKHRVIFIYGLSSFCHKLNVENKNRLGTLISKIKKLNIIHFIIIDRADKLSNFESEEWYQQMINKTDGIWVGRGLTNYSIISCTNILNNDINDNYCYVIKSGIPTLTQYVESFDILD